MNEELQAYLQGPEPVEGHGYPSLQRHALDELLRLAASAVEPVEAKIESDYETARRRSQEQFDSEKHRIESEFETRRQEIQSRRDDQLEEIKVDYEDKLSSIKVEAQQRRNRINQSAVELEQKAEKDAEEKVLEADFVAEGAVAREKQQRLEATDAFRNARLQLDTLAASAGQLLQRYRQPAPQAETEAPPEGATGVAYREQQALAEQRLEALRRLFVAQLFVGGRPVFVSLGALVLVLALLGLLYLLKVPGLPSAVVTVPAVAVVAVVLLIVAGRFLWQRAKGQVQQAYADFQEALATARGALERQHQKRLEQITQEFQAARGQKQVELRQTRETLEAAQAGIVKQRSTSLREIETKRREALGALRQGRDATLREAEAEYERQREALQRQYDRDMAEIQKRHDSEMAACEEEYRTSRQRLEERWDQGIARIRAMLDDTAKLDAQVVADWDHVLGDGWTPPRTLSSIVRFGTFTVDLQTLADTVLARADSGLDPSAAAVVPALLEFPQACSMLLEFQREGRPEALDALRAVMMRLFTSLPAGQVHFTIFDPVGLGESFAGFMHAGDYRDTLVGGRIWTETLQLQHQLEELTQHMENVIQKYLRNEFETIEQYNQQAGELAEPYRFLVIADFPTNFNEDCARRLGSIINSGARCGVHTLIAYDTRGELPPGLDIEDVSAGSIHLVYKDGVYVWQDRVRREFPLVLDRPPAEEAVTRTMHVIGKAGAESARVEVPFEAIAPTDEQLWSRQTRAEVAVPLGRTGATRLQYLRLGRGVAQHLLIAGKTGSGKSTLLHVMITNLTLWHAPSEVEIYLIDFKQGVEFKTYVTHHVPHIRAVAIESDREFGVSILRRLDAEMARRGELFRKAGVQDIAGYREATGRTMPRTVLLVDEFQVFFSDDDKLAQDAAVLLEQLVRQGRAFGIHVVLGSQTLGGAFGLTRSTIGQMAVRIALQCSEADSQLILDDDNIAARLLARPGEAIYNDVGGRVVGNSPFQTAWLPESARDTYLSKIAKRPYEAAEPREPLIVFEGNAPADVRTNRLLEAALEKGPAAEAVSTPLMWLGDPVTIKEPTAIALRRQSGANVMIVGQRDDAALNLMSTAMISVAAQVAPASVRFVLMDGSPPDSPHAGALQHVTDMLPHDCRMVSYRDVPETIAELAQEADRRVQEDHHNEPAIILMVYGVQRYRVLRRSEDAFGLSLEEEQTSRPDARFADLLREGPGVGIHVVVWADTLSTLERTLDRQTMREFDHRVLFQMSATDSSNLIDSPDANNLGLHRVLLYSEEQGGVEKFRPYAAPPKDWLAHAAKTLRQHSARKD